MEDIDDALVDSDGRISLPGQSTSSLAKPLKESTSNKTFKLSRTSDSLRVPDGGVDIDDALVDANGIISLPGQSTSSLATPASAMQMREPCVGASHNIKQEKVTDEQVAKAMAAAQFLAAEGPISTSPKLV